MLSRLFIVALWSTAGKGLASLLSFVMFNCVLFTFQCGILVQVWCLIVSIPDLCHLSYFLQFYSMYHHKVHVIIKSINCEEENMETIKHRELLSVPRRRSCFVKFLCFFAGSVCGFTCKSRPRGDNICFRAALNQAYR